MGLGEGSGGFAGDSGWYGGLASPLVADFDGDGDLDLFAEELLLNRTRHLGWKLPASVAKELALELWGTPRRPYTLLSARAAGRFGQGPMGLLRLDPDSTVVVGRGVLDDEGRAVVTSPVPNDPVLLGETTYWQALVGAPPRYTNLEVSVVGSLWPIGFPSPDHDRSHDRALLHGTVDAPRRPRRGGEERSGSYRRVTSEGRGDRTRRRASRVPSVTSRQGRPVPERRGSKARCENARFPPRLP